MKKPVVLALVVVLALAGGFAFWLLSGGGTRGSGERATDAGQAAQGASAELKPASPAPVSLELAPGASESAPTVARSGDEREAAADPSQGRVLEGFVRLPAGAPADASLRVLAFEQALAANDLYGVGGALAKAAEERDKRPWIAESPVGADGHFRLALGTGAAVHLALDGRFLYSDPLTAVAAGETSATVQAKLGGSIVGQVTLPPEADAAATLAKLEARLLPDTRELSLGGGGQNYQSRGARADAAGRFELRAVPSEQTHSLRLDPEGCADYTQAGLELAPGELRSLEIALQLGATLRGVVQDERGQPIAAAKVRAAESAMWGFAAGSRSEVDSDESGRFVLAHVPAGKSLIVAEKQGFLTSSPLTVELVDREDRPGLTLELGRGASVAGRVRFADGSAAPLARVKVSFDLEAMMGAGAANAARGAGGESVADAAGEFEVTGLGKGPFTVEASLERTGTEGAETWSGKLTKVAPDSHALELTLVAPCTLSGRVVTLAGAPVERYHVALTLPGAVFFDPGKTRGEDVLDAQGAFVVRGLEPGKWQLAVRAEGFGPMPPLEVVLPRVETEPLVLTLQPEASIAGRVLDPDGQPIAGAVVTTPADLTESMRRLRDSSGVPKATSDAEGRFLLSGLNSDVKAIHATREGFAPSVPAALELTPGQRLENLVLQLQRGARVTGEVYDKDGAKAADVQMIAQNRASFEMSMSRTDGEGNFAFEHLASGPWTITAMLGGANPATANASPDDTAAFLDNLRFEMLDLGEGEEKHVVLGAPPEAPVMVHGLVRHGREPVSPGLVSFLPDGMKSMQSMKMASLSADGTFTVQLDKPGQYVVSVQVQGTSGGLQQNNVEFRERVPEVEEHRLELELPLAGVRGVVRGADGQPSPSTRVSLTSEGGVQTGSMLGGQYAEASTDANGRYSFLYLRPGTYAVAAGGALFGGAFGTSSSAGRSVRGGIQVGEGQLVDGVDFELAAPCDIRGHVRDSTGAAVKEASIFVRDASGKLLDRFSMITSGADGSFTYSGVAPGEYLVSARSKELASSDSAAVRAAPESAASVELVLLAGTRLVIEVVDGEGNPAQAFLTVLDEHHREVQGMLGFGELSSAFSNGFDSTQQTIGPVPPGTYTVVAVSPDGTRAQKPVTLEGQPERRMKLRLKE